MHPDQALFKNGRGYPDIPVCEHFAGSEKTIRKALSIQREKGPVFDVTMDCEDGAVRGAEMEHARMIAGLLNSDDNRFNRAGVRIHDIQSPFWENELELFISEAGERIAYITIPKVNSAGQVEGILELIETYEARYRLRRRIPVHVLIEGKKALADVYRIARLRRIETLDFGLMDFVSDYLGAIPVSAMSSPGQFEHSLVRRARESIASAALEANIIPSQNVTTDLSDPENAYKDAMRGRNQFGFLRMWSIHPSQIDPVIRGMSPDHNEVDLAIKVIRAAAAADWGPIRLEGRLHDRASYRAFWTILKRAHSAGLLDDKQAIHDWFS